ncbi:uncharacterized protein LOC106674313 [Cimex lectularius]|uniref:MICOS complex subunit MIC19 n=1 Tax=Cimex lectularius TaxID=79782 RepID=A0A8I6SF09_CIMLE|nr:uncharacterized protein LOC106674313 [Cimex lectularius]
MGGQQSRRVVSVENDEPPLISVSYGVIERLSNSKAKSEPEPEAEEEKTPKIAEPHPQKSRTRNFAVNDFVHAGEEIKYKGLPYVTTKEIQQALDDEIKKNNAYWEEKLAKQKESYENTNKILEHEYLKISQQMEKYLPKVSEKVPQQDCNERTQLVLSCLQKHKQQPLLCSKEVGEFNSCVLHTKANRAN